MDNLSAAIYLLDKRGIISNSFLQRNLQITYEHASTILCNILKKFKNVHPTDNKNIIYKEGFPLPNILIRKSKKKPKWIDPSKAIKRKRH